MTSAESMPVLLMDTDVPLWIDGINLCPDKSPKFSTVDRDNVWRGLAELASNQRLKIIPFVRRELASRYPPSLERIKTWSGHRAPPKTRDVKLCYQEVTRKYGNWVDADASDPADPWLVAFAAHYGYGVLTEEKPAAKQKLKSKRPKIPDVCEAWDVRCINLDELVEHFGWLD